MYAYAVPWLVFLLPGSADNAVPFIMRATQHQEHKTNDCNKTPTLPQNLKAKQSCFIPQLSPWTLHRSRPQCTSPQGQSASSATPLLLCYPSASTAGRHYGLAGHWGGLSLAGSNIKEPGLTSFKGPHPTPAPNSNRPTSKKQVIVTKAYQSMT